MGCSRSLAGCRRVPEAGLVAECGSTPAASVPAGARTVVVVAVVVDVDGSRTVQEEEKRMAFALLRWE